eukprot:TRINITY_DN7339_c0_g1_i1.p1 TRINITY_DN7339_c0_g1~~TRINITY_DN7339_c0_g1_i1.p1  ORF type:complete len:253 (-),score=51.32 TRINITY_DN7339_c0_g1_i1:47-775(-)
MSVEQWKDSHAHLFKKAAKRTNLIGAGLPAKRDLTRFAKFPLYVRLQRQRAILKQRIKVPAAIHQFTKTLAKDQAATLFKLLGKYKPENKKEKATRLKAVAAKEVAGEKAVATAKPKVIKYGLNHVTSLIESKKAKLVVIAHDVDPIELTVWLPTLCRKMNVPFVIVKGKARLGYLVHKKQAAVLALTEVEKEDESALAQMADLANTVFSQAERKTGGLKLSTKSQQLFTKRENAAKNTIKA